MRDLVLGGDGLIGRELCNALQEQGNETTVFDLKSGNDVVRLKPTDCGGFDRIWFLAWDTGGAKYIEDERMQNEIYRHNCEILSAVAECIHQTKIPALFTTSQLAGQNTAYGMTKLIGERWMQHLGVKVARLWNVYGWEVPDVKSHVITDLALAGVTDGVVRLRTGGSERRRFLYKTDCVRALLELFEGQQQYAEIAGPAWLTIEEIARDIARQLGVPLEVGSGRGGEVLIDPEQPLEQWQPAITLEEGLARVIADAKQYVERKSL